VGGDFFNTRQIEQRLKCIIFGHIVCMVEGDL
jgi:hypothetical protein